MNPDGGEILASALTTNEVGDLTPPLLSVMADGACGEPVYRAIAERQPSSPPAVIIPRV